MGRPKSKRARTQSSGAQPQGQSDVRQGDRPTTSRATRNSSEAAVLDAVLRATNAQHDQSSRAASQQVQPSGSSEAQPAQVQPDPPAQPSPQPQAVQPVQPAPGPNPAVQAPKRDAPAGEFSFNNLSSRPNPINLGGNTGTGIGLNPGGLSPLASVCSPLGEGVSQTVREKIGKGEFVDLGLLLENWGEYVDLEQQARNVQLSVDSGGHPVFKPSVPKVKVDSLAKWTSAFLVYSSIFIEFHPQRAQEMLKYIQLIRSAAIRFGSTGWRLYDSHFRMRQQRNPQNPWSRIDAELWFLFVISNSSRGGIGLSTSSQQSQRFQVASTGNYSASHFAQRFQASSQSPQKVTGGIERTPVAFQQGAVCFDFNNTKGCSRKFCKFPHKCSDCGSENHGSSSCWAKPGVHNERGEVFKK